jgi:hypothetical protein
MGRGFACRVGRIAVAARGDLDRIRRQQVFLASMAHRMLATDAALTSVAPLSNAGTTLPSMPATAGQQTCIN